MKKIILYTLIGGLVLLIGVSAYQEATKTGASSKRLACHQGVTVFERVHDAKTRAHVNSQKFSLSASLHLTPASYKTPTLFTLVPKTTIEASVEEFLGATLATRLPLHVEVTVVENDTLDPGKKNPDAKSFLGYIHAKFYSQETLIYQVQVDFLHHEEIPRTLACIRDSFTRL
ncbi:MAG: hypothetical protein IBX45_11555 [Campylobacterales bacterium]|nr:hypothetical protein [Campylobacterales bacterium]